MFLSYFDRMYDEHIGVLHMLAGRVRLESSKCQTSNVAHGKVTHWCWREKVGGGEGERERKQWERRERGRRGFLHKSTSFSTLNWGEPYTSGATLRTRVVYTCLFACMHNYVQAMYTSLVPRHSIF